MEKFTDEQLISSLKQLKNVKPNQQWASLLKAEIALQKETEKVPGIMEVLKSMFAQKKTVYAFATMVCMVVGIFGFAQYTFPGDLLFPIKKIAEQTQDPLQVASIRSQELVQIIKERKTQNLAPAVNEFKASIADAVKNLSQKSKQDKASLQAIAADVKKIEGNSQQLKTLADKTSVDTEMGELNSILASLVKEQIDDLNGATLTQSQQATLKTVQEYYNQGKYSDALEQILLINY